MSSTREKTIDERIIEAQELIKNSKDYEGAEKLFLTVAEEDPEDERGWYGLLRACTCRFDAVEYLIRKRCVELPKEYENYFQKACETANAKNREIIKKRWELFTRDYKELYEMCVNKKKKRKEEFKTIGKPRDEEDEEEEKQTSSGGSSDDAYGCLGLLVFIILAFIVMIFLSRQFP